MKTITIGLLGCGNVGGGVYRLIKDFEHETAHRHDLKINIKKILVKDVTDPRLDFVDKSLLTEDVSQVVEDPEITLVAEFMGGEQPAADFMLRALNHKKTVVTANKVALALNWPKLQKAAKANGVGLYYEASVCGAIPIIRVLNTSLHSNRVDHLMGIVNGTTNYILSRMTDEGDSYDAVLADAQRLGLAEPDPFTDVEGLDAAYKLSLMSSLAFHARVPFDKVFCQGITKVTPMDIACGKEMGYVVKLLAIAKRHGMTLETRVHPTFIPKDHPLASVSGSFNAVYLKGHACQEMMFQGRGAGDMPTASAVVADILNAALTDVHPHPTFKIEEEPASEMTFADNWETRFFVRLSVKDTPGALMQIAGCFAQEGISIASMMQKTAVEDGRLPLIFVTHQTFEKSMGAALEHLDPDIAQVESVIRVEA